MRRRWDAARPERGDGQRPRRLPGQPRPSKHQSRPPWHERPARGCARSPARRRLRRKGGQEQGPCPKSNRAGRHGPTTANANRTVPGNEAREKKEPHQEEAHQEEKTRQRRAPGESGQKPRSPGDPHSPPRTKERTPRDERELDQDEREQGTPARTRRERPRTNSKHARESTRTQNHTHGHSSTNMQARLQTHEPEGEALTRRQRTKPIGNADEHHQEEEKKPKGNEEPERPPDEPEALSEIQNTEKTEQETPPDQNPDEAGPARGRNAHHRGTQKGRGRNEHQGEGRPEQAHRTCQRPTYAKRHPPQKVPTEPRHRERPSSPPNPRRYAPQREPGAHQAQSREHRTEHCAPKTPSAPQTNRGRPSARPPGPRNGHRRPNG